MDIKDIMAVAEKAEDLQAEIAGMELELKEKKKELQGVVSEQLPALMAEEMIRGFELKSGATVAIKDVVAGNLPASGAILKAKPDKRRELVSRLNAGLLWLRDNKAGDIIKNEVSVLIPTGADKIAAQAFDVLQKLDLDPHRAETVHPQTLSKFLREVNAEGVDIPEYPFSLFLGQVAEIKFPK